MLPMEEVLLASIVLSIVMAVLYRLLTNQEELKKAKRDADFYKKQIKKAQKAGDKAKEEKFTNEMLKASQRVLRQTMKPMFASMIIFLVAIGWLGATYAELLVSLPFPIPFIGSELNWFLWYLIIIIPGMQIFKKLLGVEQ